MKRGEVKGYKGVVAIWGGGCGILWCYVWVSTSGTTYQMYIISLKHRIRYMWMSIFLYFILVRINLGPSIIKSKELVAVYRCGVNSG